MKNNISIENMFNNYVHYGHSIKNWNPKMKKYIYGIHNGIHIINLDKTLVLFNIALKKIKNIINNNGKILFVGTKKEAKEKIKYYAESCNQFFINNRWLGGTLTNWKTIKKSIKKYKLLYNNYKNLQFNKFTKKESIIYLRNLNKLKKNLYGIQNMNKLPDAIFVIDANYEKIAIKESIKMNIPIFSIVDTDSNPDYIDYIIPGNDDSIKSIDFYLSSIYKILK
ncbi:30S ribosomal protein S2 [endosymbiont of Euscepes postfasciatus]|uniref:30S ribosomal protein S2 n=1 Tax=endosymbiont of Euscepes postfasciatus TaxID=650377 RepID=UPI000DC71AEE|nr:30S ribosomal protein S2 [endosymbiont of Euscepes postfasciatus]BBA84726.1 30S ribosomal protein S2 [endosymbiont of Euscepes postfasciatus]